MLKGTTKTYFSLGWLSLEILLVTITAAQIKVVVDTYDVSTLIIKTNIISFILFPYDYCVMSYIVADFF